MQNDLVALTEKLTLVSSVVIALSTNPSLDTTAAGLSLYLSLTSVGKKVKVVCDSEPIVRDSHLVGLDQIKKDQEDNSLVLTINVEGDVVDKVTSAVVDEKISLTIIPKPGKKSIVASDIVFSKAGTSGELILAIGGASISDFGTLNTQTLVNISNTQSAFGQINFVDPTSSICELATAILQELKLPINEDIANNLMYGIEDSTNNFQSENMTADTFEALAILYRAGAKHHPVNAPQQTATIIDNTPIIEERQIEDQKDIKAIEAELQAMTTPFDDKDEIKDEWLKPKILTSSDK